ncbi:uncharacterized protein LODBEIA_P34830 [Lodderomyces beijingensis]|uniref:Uncharacterized protein n=1 Tax=Lodderomyces beijingensis TaxID=1775926 RepID=A0ABP0ZMW5_9ASCO
MPPRKKKDRFVLSQTYEQPTPEIEDEILEAYSDVLGEDKDEEEDQDLRLSHLPQVFRILKIPRVFVRDIETAIEYYYNHMGTKTGTIDRANAKQSITFDMLESYTITSPTVKTHAEILDIVDIDKLIRNLTRLVKFRDNFAHIKSSWQLFLEHSGSKVANIENFKMELPQLKSVKTQLNLDNDQHTGERLSDGFMIDMLGCCKLDSRERLLNFEFKSGGASVGIKDFAEILGRIGEFD